MMTPRAARAVLATLATATFAVSSASAQPAPEPAKPAAPPASAPPTMDLGPGKDAVKDQPDALAIALAVQPGGLTFEAVSKEAVATSPQVLAKEAELEGAHGAVSSTIVGFFPRLTLTASYTRLSEVEGGSLGGGAIVGAANAGAITVGPCPTDPTAQCALDSGGVPVQAASFSFPTVLNQIAFTAGLSIPISDYFLRAVQAYNAADHNEAALKMATESQRLAVSTDAKLALLSWILAKGQVVVADQSVEQAKGQLTDAKAIRKADKGSDADVLRIEALLSQTEFTLAEARALETIAEQRLRLLMHAQAGRALSIGVDVLTPPALPALPSVEELVAEALKNRLEILSTEEAKLALEEVEATTAAGFWPRLDGFANVMVANPNQRIFPQREQFDATWDVGLRLTWVVNDTFSTLGATAQARSRTKQLDAQKQLLVDAVRLEVIQAHTDIAKAIPSIEAANRGVVAAEEGLRITKIVFAVGNGTGTALADAETAVTTARLRKLAAHVGLQAALVRLDHATGRNRGVVLAKK
ncbi:MAG: TolC family protein [Polyangiaceae bacterium]|nr:TolC family protein [Polyangiaceae bacterium]MBK8939975.1 TolC family protein [Polyangiaceae bacterium]